MSSSEHPAAVELKKHFYSVCLELFAPNKFRFVRPFAGRSSGRSSSRLRSSGLNSSKLLARSFYSLTMLCYCTLLLNSIIHYSILMAKLNCLRQPLRATPSPVAVCSSKKCVYSSKCPLFYSYVSLFLNSFSSDVMSSSCVPLAFLLRSSCVPLHRSPYGSAYSNPLNPFILLF